MKLAKKILPFAVILTFLIVFILAYWTFYPRPYSTWQWIVLLIFISIFAVLVLLTGVFYSSLNKHQENDDRREEDDEQFKETEDSTESAAQPSI